MNRRRFQPGIDWLFDADQLARASQAIDTLAKRMMRHGAVCRVRGAGLRGVGCIEVVGRSSGKAVRSKITDRPGTRADCPTDWETEPIGSPAAPIDKKTLRFRR